MTDVIYGVKNAVVICLLGMHLVAVVPVLVGWKSTVVVSGSMAPAIRPGDVIVAAPVPDDGSQPEPGQVVLVDDPALPGQFLMHRLVRYDEQGRSILKGDANPAADSTPVPIGNLRGLPRLRIPVVGLPSLWARQGLFLPAIAAGFILLALVAWQPGPPPPRGRRRRSDADSAEPQDQKDPAALAAVSSVPLHALPYRLPVGHRPGRGRRRAIRSRYPIALLPSSNVPASDRIAALTPQQWLPRVKLSRGSATRRDISATSRPASENRRRGRAAAMVVGLLACSAVVWQSSHASFSGTTTNNGNEMGAGTVTITDNGSGTATIAATAMAPCATAQVACIGVKYTGSLAPPAIKVYNDQTAAQERDTAAGMYTTWANTAVSSMDDFTDFKIEINDTDVPNPPFNPGRLLSHGFTGGWTATPVLASSVAA